MNGQSLTVQRERSVVVALAYGVKHQVNESGITAKNKSTVRVRLANDSGHVDVPNIF